MTTIEELLAAWDAGKVIATCSMGGKNAVEEYGIHLIAMEKLRAMYANPLDYEALDRMEDVDKRRETWTAYRDMIDETSNVAKIMEEVNTSSAMCSAAGNLAAVYIRNGYTFCMEVFPEDRIIKVSKTRCVLPEHEVS